MILFFGRSRRASWEVAGRPPLTPFGAGRALVTNRDWHVAGAEMLLIGTLAGGIAWVPSHRRCGLMGRWLGALLVLLSRTTAASVEALPPSG